MRPLSEVDPGLVEAVAEYRRKRGRPKSPAPKIYIGLRMAPDVVESLKASGPGYNARVEHCARQGSAPRKRRQRKRPPTTTRQRESPLSPAREAKGALSRAMPS